MLDYIVLGQIPGTGLELGFTGYMAVFTTALSVYFVKRFHPGAVRRVIKAVKASLKIKNIAGYKQRAWKQLVHLRDDVLAPKLKFLK